MRDQKHLIEGIKNGDQSAFKLLFDTHYQALCAYLQGFTSDLDTAEELVQLTFVSLWRKRKTIEIHTSIKSYLYKMSYNLFLQSLRQRNKEHTFLEDLKQEALQEVFETTDIDREDYTNRLKKCIEQLPERCQEILNLKLRGLKYKEIADELGISIKTVESQMRIAFTKIREEFKDGLILFFLLKE
ncbi:RNA polymerase sigma-70 factor [Arenibacter sp. 6A1]|uniref:RNA polymerase sigma factor n=1 Tax=Arenibacter sp. 6A1 TaxID=2720391 RepID=UPI0014476540|nr:RNA polymerase sigma-70 factor [Arenibacter sp. 6A1]NKI26929.1 RNA polymerase sigma-70 factor [Arenibacter sp. 6A1]